MDTAKLFKNGRSQAVRLPKNYALPGNEVYVKRVNGIVMLIPKDKNPWQPFIDSLDKFSDYYLTTTGELRAHFTERMFANFKVILNYDATPAVGAGSTDTKYMLGLGYSF